ncbi:hypothetical protein [Micromonospora haikouensis]
MESTGWAVGERARKESRGRESGGGRRAAGGGRRAAGGGREK